jgi:hypothetical protein
MKTDGLVELGEETTLVQPGETVGFLSYASLKGRGSAASYQIDGRDLLAPFVFPQAWV